MTGALSEVNSVSAVLEGPWLHFCPLTFSDFVLHCELQRGCQNIGISRVLGYFSLRLLILLLDIIIYFVLW